MMQWYLSRGKWMGIPPYFDIPGAVKFISTIPCYIIQDSQTEQSITIITFSEAVGAARGHERSIFMCFAKVKW